jgi:prevent-host-death family protein
MQMEAGIRELKTRLSAYLRQVRAGGTVIITNRGKPVGRIVPEGQSPEEHLKTLNQAGLVAWSGKRLLPLAPLARAKGDKTVAGLLLEDRE